MKKPFYNLLLVASIFGLCLAGGVVFFHNVEGMALVDAIYFTTMTLTTVGYGDLAPQTDIGKLFTAVYALVGVALFLGLATSLFSLIIEGLRQKSSQAER